MNRKQITLAVCIVLHALVLVNIWYVSKMTPRVIEVSACYI